MKTRAAVLVAAIASVVNVALTVTNDAQQSYDDLREAIARVETRAAARCP